MGKDIKDKSVLRKREIDNLIKGYNIIYEVGVDDELGWYRLWNAFYSELLKEKHEKRKNKQGHQEV